MEEMQSPRIVNNMPNIPAIDINDPKFISILISVFVVLFTMVIFILWLRKKNARRGVLLMGLSDSGKTLIFTRLIHNKYVMTHTSVKENGDEYFTNKRFLRVIDIPGHERLRGMFFDEYKRIARGIVFVVDSTTFVKDIKDVAEFLYTLLSDIIIGTNCPPFLILCNKQDQTMAKGCSLIKSLLEREMNVLRTTKSSQLESTNNMANNNTFLGKQDQNFEFAHLLPIKVEFAECTAYDADPDNPADLESLKMWLEKLA